MARSPLTLAATVSAALPGAEAVSVRSLTTGSAGRNESAVVILQDGREVVVRIPHEDATAAELATEAVALRAVTDGARALVNFAIPQYLGAAPTEPTRAFVTTFVNGYQVDTAHIPAGPGVAVSMGNTLADIHAMPTSIVRNAGLPVRSAAELRAELTQIVEDASATGRVPVRLMVRWREAMANDALWQFEPVLSLGGAGPLAFVYQDVNGVPTVAGVIDWHGLSVTDPAIDLQFLQTVPDAADWVLDAYRATAHRSGDEYLQARARVHAELEFARWLLHGTAEQDETVIADASSLLDGLAENVRDDDLLPTGEKTDLRDAMAALENVPNTTANSIDTSMHTDVYDPDELALSGVSLSEPDSAVDPSRSSRSQAAAAQTQALTDSDLDELNRNTTTPEIPTPFGLEPMAPETADEDRQVEDVFEQEAADTSEAARAARAAIDRWKVDPSV